MDEKNTTREAIAESFKDQVMAKPFNKITIKDITNGAGIIRPTFYNYFHDKNQVFDYILDDELFDTLDDLVGVGLYREAVSYIFTYFDSNRSFYKKAFKIQGQNSFEDTLNKKMISFVEDIFEDLAIHKTEDLAIIDKAGLASYYAIATVLFIKLWINSSELKDYEVKDIIKSYEFLATHSIYDLIDTDNL